MNKFNRSGFRRGKGGRQGWIQNIVHIININFAILDKGLRGGVKPLSPCSG